MSGGPWAVILGASSGFGAATARELASKGYSIFGVHLDRRGAQPAIDELLAELRETGVEVEFRNVNAARDDTRAKLISELQVLAGPGGVAVYLHSLAFGTLRPYLADGGEARSLSRKQLEMTLDVMAHSFVYWAQGLAWAGLFSSHARVFAMTSAGSMVAWPSYGAVSAAKCALESHVRQLALELAPSGVTVNAIMAGVTRTAALDKIPGAEAIAAAALARNPRGRLTTPEDVARCIAAFVGPGTDWMTGNVIRVDGGETVAG
jgi:enoyl-[acyl-carrier protein] reductase III